MVDIATLGIEVRSDSVPQASTRLDNLSAAGKRAEGATNSLSSSFANVTKYIQAAAAAMAAWKLTQYIQEATMLSARVETLGVVMKVVGNNAGYTGAQMETFAKQVQKMGITTQESMNSLIKMAGAQMDLTKASKIARVAQDAAVIGNINSSEAFGRMIQGIRSGETEILKTIGINVQLGEAQEKYAKSLGKTTKDLTAAEKTQANMNAVLDYGKNINGAYEASLSTAGKQLLSMARYTEELKLAVGQVFLPVFTRMVWSLVDALKSSNNWMENNKSTLAAWSNAISQGYNGVLNWVYRLNTAYNLLGIAAARAWQTLNAPAALTGNQTAIDQIKNAQAYIVEASDRVRKNGVEISAIIKSRELGLTVHDRKGSLGVDEQKVIDAAKARQQQEAAQAAAQAAEKSKEAKQKAEKAAEQAMQRLKDQIFEETKNHIEEITEAQKLQADAEHAAFQDRIQEAELLDLWAKRDLEAKQKQLDAINQINAASRDLSSFTRDLDSSMIEDPYERQRKQMNDYYDDERDRIKEKMRLFKDSTEVQQNGTKALHSVEQKRIKETAEIDRQSFTGRISVIGDYASIGADLFNGLADAQNQSSRSGFEAAKAYSMGAAIMSTAAAIIGQLTGPDAWTPAAWARSVVAGVLGAIQIAKIASTSFKGGGSAPTASAGSYAYGGATTSTGLGNISKPLASISDSQTNESFDRLTSSTDNVAVAIGKLSKTMDEFKALFEEGGAGYSLATNAPGIGIANNGQDKTGIIKGLLQLDPMHNATFGTNPISGLKAAGSTLFGWGNSFKTTGGGIALEIKNGMVSADDYITQKKSGGWFSSDKKRTIYTGNAEAGDYMQSILSLFLVDINRMARTLGTRFNASEYTAERANIATAGRTPEDIAKDLEAWTLKQLQGFAMTIDGLESVVGAYDDAYAKLKLYNDALVSTNDALGLIGKSQIQGSLRNGEWLANMQQSLFGGIEGFNDAIDTYFTSMFSDQEQKVRTAAQATAQVNREFLEMNKAVPKTKEEFRNLVNGLNLMTESGAQTFASLMLVSEAFATMIDQAEEMRKAQEDLNRDAVSRLLHLNKGQSALADLYDLQISHQQELKDALEQGLDVGMLATTQQLEWADAVKQASETVSESSKKMIDDVRKALNASVDTTLSILQYKLKLQVGPGMGVSPEQAYFNTKQQFTSNTDSKQVTALAQEFLDSSRTYNASGPQFQTDLKFVLGKLDSFANVEGTISDTQKQIDLLTDIKAALGSGNDTVLTRLGSAWSALTLQVGGATDGLQAEYAKLVAVLNGKDPSGQPYDLGATLTTNAAGLINSAVAAVRTAMIPTGNNLIDKANADMAYAQINAAIEAVTRSMSPTPIDTVAPTAANRLILAAYGEIKRVMAPVDGIPLTGNTATNVAIDSALAAVRTAMITTGNRAIDTANATAANKAIDAATGAVRTAMTLTGTNAIPTGVGTTLTNAFGDVRTALNTNLTTGDNSVANLLADFNTALGNAAETTRDGLLNFVNALGAIEEYTRARSGYDSKRADIISQHQNSRINGYTASELLKNELTNNLMPSYRTLTAAGVTSIANPEDSYMVDYIQLRGVLGRLNEMVNYHMTPDLKYDVNKDRKIDQADLDIWTAISRGSMLWSSLGLPVFAAGGIATGPSIAGEGVYNEAIIPLPDGRTVPVRMQGSADNKDVVEELKEQNRLLRQIISHSAAGVKVAQAVGTKLIEQGETNNKNGKAAANAAALAKAA